MTRTISIVTAVHGPSMKFLPEAYRSIVNQEMPSGWEWEWIVQEDGRTGDAAAYLPDDQRISHGTGRPLGQGIARTYALSRASGDLVKVLDSDDLLAAGALGRDVVALRDPRLEWSACRALDLLPDGRTVGYDSDPPAGRIERGSLLDYWLTHGYRASVHPATICIRRSLLLMLGGWMSLPASEDTGLMMAASAVSNGYFIDEPGLYYRKWPGQVTADPVHTANDELRARNAVIVARARALADQFPSGWSTT
jgi:glycosyltransferase involved in cell wall biosynthesis